MTATNNSVVRNGIVYIYAEEQHQLVTQEATKCYMKIINETHEPLADPGYCPTVWDGIMCWDRTPNGTLNTQGCANYFNRFNITAEASKECMPSGNWYFSPKHNQTWSNYSQCVYNPPTSLMAAHIPILKIINNTGYSISLISLLVAVTIMLYFKKLRCPRTSVHVNLFLSFILRAAVCLLKEVVLVNGVALSSDFSKNDLGLVELTDSSHWECKFLMTLFNYFVGANCIWIFMEGLYLNNLLFWSVFSESSSVFWYIIAGWSLPLTWIVPWIVVRALYDNHLCWNAYINRNNMLIVRVPMMFFLVINFIFFINIVRVLFTKLRASNTNTPEARAYRYRTLARSTLVLIPLFGIHYMVFGALPENVEPQTELIKLYFESILTSIQGFCVALLFCFLNGEVQSEIKKKWYRYQLHRKGSGGNKATRNTWMTVSSYVTRARHSLHSINFTEKQDPVSMNASAPQSGGTTNRFSNGSATQLRAPTSVSKTDDTEAIELRTVEEDEEHEPMMSGERV
uniref:Orphan G-protein coupled receptor 13 n=1 Tax=Platynereis dumerilii TaxID=6359 RepID=A0A0K0PUR6_PLADU|nr:orphan G-protein coupled receptor 13 [Platynereis dumerilii]